MLLATPAPVSTTSACLPLAQSFLTVSGVAATRVSPGRVSRGMPISMLLSPAVRPARMKSQRRSLEAAIFPQISDRGGDGAPDVLHPRLAADVRRARRRRIGEHALDRAHDRSRGRGMTEEIEHQRA